MTDPNTLTRANVAINVLTDAGLIGKRTAATLRKKLRASLNDEISYWSDKGADAIIDALNKAYRAIP